jgi:hypothetical protein
MRAIESTRSRFVAITKRFFISMKLFLYFSMKFQHKNGVE